MSDWGALAPRWERGRQLLWEGTRPVSDWLVEKLDPAPGQTILDLAAGTGDTGFLAAPRLEPGGRLISGDRAWGMVEAAQRRATELGLGNVEFRLLDAERLELDDSSVDGVLNRFGYILKGDPPPALREIRRVLRPGGRLAFAVWAARERNPWMTVPAAVMVDLGFLVPRVSDRGDPFAKRSTEHTAQLLADAGFPVAEIEELPMAYRFADADELWVFASELRGPIALAIEQLGDEQRAEVRSELVSRAARTPDGGYALAGV